MGANIRELIASYPRERVSLPPDVERIFTEHYLRNRSGRGVLERGTRFLESWMHHAVASTAETYAPEHRILELGCGALNHLPYEGLSCAYDVVEPFVELFESGPHRNRISNHFRSIHEIPENNRYDRIISIAALEHVQDLPQLLAKTSVMLSPGGIFAAGIPSEGGLLWGSAWRCTSGLAFYLRYKRDYGLIMRHEHLNSRDEILTLIRAFFADVRVLGFPLPFKHASLYTCVLAASPLRTTP